MLQRKHDEHNLDIDETIVTQLLEPKLPDSYSGHPIYSVLQGIQLELLLGRTRSDRPCSLH